MNELLIKLTKFVVSFKDTNQSPIDYFNSLVPDEDFIWVTYLAILVMAILFLTAIAYYNETPRYLRVVILLALSAIFSYSIIAVSVSKTLRDNRIHSSDIPENPRDYDGTKIAILEGIHHDDLSNYQAIIKEKIITELPKDNETIEVENLKLSRSTGEMTLILNDAKRRMGLGNYDIKFINPEGYTDEQIRILKESKPDLIKMTLGHYKHVEFDITFSYDKNGKTSTETIPLLELAELKIFNQEYAYTENGKLAINPLRGYPEEGSFYDNKIADIVDIQLVITDEEQARKILNDRKSLE